MYLLKMAHTPIDSKQQIRILRLQPLSYAKLQAPLQPGAEPPIYCDLFIVDRDDEPQYEALSYTWGSSEERRSIQLKHSPEAEHYTEVKVTDNLHSALQHFRHEDDVLNIWIDALCINQEHHAEKAVQVARMRDVYSAARHTRVWLGPATEDSDEAVDWLDKLFEAYIERAYHELVTVRGHSAESLERSSHSQLLAKDFAASVLDQVTGDSLAVFGVPASVVRLLSRPYWSRVWILQEIVVSDQVGFYCGLSTMDLKSLSAAILCLDHVQSRGIQRKMATMAAAIDIMRDNMVAPNDQLTSGKDGIVDMALLSRLINEPEYVEQFNAELQATSDVAVPTSADRALAMRRGYQATRGKGSSLIRLLADTSVDKACTDSRDRVYALLGMSCDAAALGIDIDYEPAYTCNHLYCDVAFAIIAAGGVDLLFYPRNRSSDFDDADRQGSARPTDGPLPTWVPDWRVPMGRSGDITPWTVPYQRSTEIAGVVRGTDRTTIVLKGYIAGTIATLEEKCNDGKYMSRLNRDAALRYLADIGSLCNKAKNMGSEIYLYVHDINRLAATIGIAGMIGMTADQPASEGECMLGWQAVQRDFRNVRMKEVDIEQSEDMQHYYDGMANQTSRRPFLTSTGFVGLAHADAQIGDVVTILYGAKFLYTLRPTGAGTYTLVGDTYVYGLMNGEVSEYDFEVKDFCLV